MLDGAGDSFAALILFYNGYEKLYKKLFSGLHYLQMLALAALCLPFPAYAGFLLVFLALISIAHIFNRNGKSYYGAALAFALILQLFYPHLL